jgi:hypothetical protein
MSDLSEKTILVVDSGMFLPFALRMADSFGRVLFWNPVEQASPRIHEAQIAEGFDEITVVSSIFSELDEVDVFAFPDCIQPWFQNWLKEKGKKVWGSGMATQLEWNRDLFRIHMENLGLPVHPYHIAHGLHDLTDYLKDKKDQYIRISRYRGNGETWHWIDSELSSNRLDELAIEYGPIQETIDFLVESSFDAKEVGYDGFFYGGRFPGSAFHGIERKDKSYFGALCDYDSLPAPLKTVTDSIGPLLENMGYSNNFHAEVRVTPDGTPYFTDPTCFSEDTEVLTDCGWKLFQELNGDERVCTLEPNTNQIEYHKPSQHVRYWHSGEMLEIANRKRDLELLVTPNHSVWGRTKPHKPLSEFRADSLPPQLSIPRTGIWNGVEVSAFVLPAYSNRWSSGKGRHIQKSIDLPAQTISMDSWLRFLGVFLSEGHTSMWQVGITQTKYREEILEILNAIPFDWRPYPKGFRTSSIQLASFLSSTGLRHERRIPSFVKMLSSRQINLFLDSYCLGDGSNYRGNRIISTTSKNTANDIQELFLKAGSVASIRTVKKAGSDVRISNGKYITKHDSLLVCERSTFKDFWVGGGNRKHLYINPVAYHGMVYDVTVKNHILYVRRNGKPCWSGNCRHASPAGEPLLEACSNLPEIVWSGAHGEYIEPEWESKFVAQVLIDHKDDGKEHWRTVRVPDLRWVKLYNASKIGNDIYAIPPLPHSCASIGSALGQGNTPEEAVEELKKHASELDGQDVTVDTASLASAIAESDSDEPGSVEMGGKDSEEAVELARDED